MVAWFENGVPVQEKDRAVYLGDRKLGLDGEATEPVLLTQGRLPALLRGATQHWLGRSVREFLQ
jgi:hypothetical protein